ncbi:MAG: CRTAC1 family protein [Pseudomonadota bacterium]
MFANITVGAGVNFEHRISAAAPVDAELISAGVAAGDYDDDGYIDLYVVGGDGATPNLLYRNLGDDTIRFEERGVAAGVGVSGRRGSGPVFADLDGDRHLDLFVGAVAGDPIAVFANNGDGTFTERTGGSGLDGLTRENTFSAALADYDLDGDLDMALSHWDWKEGIMPAAPIPDTETLWSNRGDGSFENVSVPSVLSGAIGGDGTDYSFTPNFADIDNDGSPDLLLASDFGTSQVFLNNRDGTFSEATTPAISDENGMGAAVGDYDNDGDLDWFVTAIAAAGVSQDNGFNGNRLYRNDGTGTFGDVTTATGVRIGGWGWASCFADFNNDGVLDIFHVNGWHDARFSELPARLFIADGNGRFDEVALASGVTTDRQGRGVVCADFDRDGDVDLFIVNNRNFAELYENRLAAGRNWLTVRLRGAPPNTQGVGARIFVTAAGATQIREIRVGSNFVSQHVAEAHFGLAEAEEITELRVVWPGGGETVLNAVATNQLLAIGQ